MRIKEISINELIPYVNNPRDNDAAVDAVASSIKNFGFKVPIIVDKNKEIVAGHTRYKAAKKLGLEIVPVIIADDLTPEQVKAFRLADNKVAEIATWNTELLNSELEELKKLGVDMNDFGFEFIESTEEPELEEDEPDIEPPEEPITQLGDVWQLGEHRLICGDCTQEENFQQLMGEEQADLLLTDPPYNVNYAGKEKDLLKSRPNKRVIEHGSHIENDLISNELFVHFLNNSFSNSNKFMKNGAAFYIWMQSWVIKTFYEACENVNWKVRQQLIWVKNHFVIGRSDYQWIHEPCIYGWKEGAAHYFINDRTKTTVIDDKPDIDKMNKEELKDYVKELLQNQLPTTVIDVDKPMRSEDHPTMKPVKLFGQLIANSSRPGDIVMDMFAGSGTTVIACEQLKRKARVMELDPKYCDVIVRRWEEFTGQKAVKIN